MIEQMLWAIMLVLAGSLAVLSTMARRMPTAMTGSAAGAPGRRVAVIVPVAGEETATEASVHSLLNQLYSAFEVVFVVEDAGDPAAKAVQALVQRHPTARRVVAGRATDCGQKNHNLLAGIAAVEGRSDVLVFADAGHVFPDAWLERLVAPIAKGEAEVTTGYYAVTPARDGWAEWGFALSVEFLSWLRRVPGIGQPWGGATAISRDTFDRLHVADAWRGAVVDDVVLARVLKEAGVRARAMPGIRLDTPVEAMAFADWYEWLVRQFQYIRFILPGTWFAAGVWGDLLMAGAVVALVLVVTGLAGVTSALLVAVSALYLAVLAVVMLEIRRMHPAPCSAGRWLAVGFLTLAVACLAHLAAGVRREIRWRGIGYRIGAGGRVLAVHRASRAQADGTDNTAECRTGNRRTPK
jgi:hypothetical protein